MEKLAIFISSLKEEGPPSALSLALKALWYDANGNWDKAHDLAQEQENESGNWVHAYLHRKEGDEFNASYWYRRAGKPVCKNSLEDEWEQIAKSLLK